VTEPVNRRGYDNAARRARSARTRAEVLAAARSLFTGRGYTSTTVADIAAEAGVHVDTVYRLVGRKPEIVRELVEAAISGTATAVVAEDRDHVRALKAEPDPERMLAVYARAVREIHERLGPLWPALTGAAAVDPDVAEVWTAISRRRAQNMRKLVAELDAAGGLRDDLPHDRAADTIWATNSPELYALLVVERGWGPDDYEAWLLDLWRRVLLPGPTGSGDAAGGDAEVG
jgi:AcrR family transcriptional regulator